MTEPSGAAMLSSPLGVQFTSPLKTTKLSNDCNSRAPLTLFSGPTIATESETDVKLVVAPALTTNRSSACNRIWCARCTSKESSMIRPGVITFRSMLSLKFRRGPSNVIQGSVPEKLP